MNSLQHQQPGPSGIQQSMESMQNFNNILDYFNVKHDDNNDQRNNSRQQQDKQLMIPPQKSLIETSIDGFLGDFNAKDIDDINRLLFNYFDSDEMPRQQKHNSRQINREMANIHCEDEALINSNLLKLKFNEKKMFRLFRENMLYDPMDDIIEKIEAKKRRRAFNRSKTNDHQLITGNDRPYFIDSDYENTVINNVRNDDGQLDDNQSMIIGQNSYELSFYSELEDNDDGNDNNNDDLDRKKFKSDPIESQSVSNSNLIPNISTKNNEQSMVNEQKQPKSICRKIRKQILRKDYLSSLPRYGNVFNLIRYSCTSRIAQNFIRTLEGRRQILDSIKNCRNMTTLIIPESEQAIPSKVLLISQQNFKKTKNVNHKFRNSGWHRQLNQGVKMESFLFQTNFRFLKKNLRKQSWFIEEDQEQEDNEDGTKQNAQTKFEDNEKHRRIKNFYEDHTYMNPFNSEDETLFDESNDQHRKLRQSMIDRRSMRIELIDLNVNNQSENTRKQYLRRKLLQKLKQPVSNGENREEKIKVSVLTDENWLKNQHNVAIRLKNKDSNCNSNNQNQKPAQKSTDIDEYRQKRTDELKLSLEKLSIMNENDNLWKNFQEIDRKYKLMNQSFKNNDTQNYFQMTSNYHYLSTPSATTSSSSTSSSSTLDTNHQQQQQHHHLSILKRFDPNIFDDYDCLKYLWIKLKSNDSYHQQQSIKQFLNQIEKLLIGRKQMIRLESTIGSNITDNQQNIPDNIQLHGLASVLESMADNNLPFCPYFN